MNQTQQEILELQKLDPLSTAEKITGASYKEDKGTEALGILMHIEKGKAMRELLSQAGDTQFSNTVKDYLRITCNFGFEVVYTEPFETDRGEEKLYVLFHRELGILICFDTFTYGKENEPGVNGGHMYYNWSPNNMKQGGPARGGGHFFFNKNASHIGLFESDLETPYYIRDFPEEVKWNSDNMTWTQLEEINKPIYAEQQRLLEEALANGKRILWIGNHDCREGIITTIKAMFENGKFFPVWQECAFNWLTHYREHTGNLKYPFTDHYEVTMRRIEAMPEYVKTCINNTYRP